MGIIRHANTFDAITIITCTGDRPEALDLCARWMRRQTFSGSVQWLIVDDGVVPSAQANRLLSIPDWETRIIRVMEPTKHRQNTLGRNLQRALPFVRNDLIFFIEDDDCYGPRYLSFMNAIANAASRDISLIGQTPSVYYNLQNRHYRNMPAPTWCSLCQTAMRKSAIPELQSLCDGDRAIDTSLWARFGGQRIDVSLDRIQDCGVLGIKSMPGRQGIGVGHRTLPTPAWVPDLDLAFFRRVLGGTAAFYTPFLGNTDSTESRSSLPIAPGVSSRAS